MSDKQTSDQIYCPKNKVGVISLRPNPKNNNIGNNDMREIEILVELHSSVNQAQSALKNFTFKGSKKTTDIYYFDPLRKNLQPNLEHKLGECCRLRQKGDKAYVTYKTDHYDNGIWIFSDEYETEVSDLKVMEKIFTCLGLKKLVVIDNIKYLYENENYEIALEEVADLGCFLEVEALHDDNQTDVDKIKSQIHDFIKQLGLSVGPELNAGKPELMLKKLQASKS